MKHALEINNTQYQAIKSQKIKCRSTTNFHIQSKKTIEITKSTKQILSNKESTFNKYQEQHSTILRNEIQDSPNFL